MGNSIHKITTMDLFPINPTFYIRGNEGFKSVTGSITTILMTFCFCGILYLNLKHYIYTDTPTELKITEKLNNYKVKLNSENLLIAYSIEFEQNQNIELNSFLKTQIELSDNTNNIKYLDNLYFDNCSKINFEDFSITEETKINLIKNAKCLIMNNLNMTINDNIYSDLIISLTNDNQNNETFLNIYKNIPIIYKFYYQFIINTPSKFRKIPMQKDINILSKKLYLSNLYEYTAKIKTITTKKKSDFIHKKSKRINTFNYISDIIEYSNNNNINNSKILKIILNLDNYHTKIIYCYPKIWDILSNLGGTLHLVHTFILLIFGWLQRLEQKRYIIRKCFNNDGIFAQVDNSNSFTKKIKELMTHPEDADEILEDENKNKKNKENEKSGNSSSINTYLKQSMNNKNENVLLKFNNNDVQINNYTNDENKKTFKVISPKRRKTFSKVSISTIKRRKSRAELQFLFFSSKKSPYGILFQMFLGIENIIKWNEEWLTYKNVILSKRLQIAMKYTDLFKLYALEASLDPFNKNKEEYIKNWNLIKEKDKTLETMNFLRGLKEIVEPLSD